MRPLFVFLLVLGLATPSAAQTTWYVDGSASAPGAGTQASPYSSIAFAIAQPTTVDGDSIAVSPGLYATPLDYSGKTLSILSVGGPSSTTLQATGSVVTVASGEGAGTGLIGFTIRGGTGTPVLDPGGQTIARGGGVLVLDSQLEIIDCTIRENSATQGAGVFQEGGSVEIVGCTITSNTASGASNLTVAGGGVACTRGALRLTNTSVTSNVVQGQSTSSTIYRRGGGVFCGLVVSGIPPSLRMDGCMLEDNHTMPTGRGGGAFVGSTDAIIDGCTLLGNSTGTSQDSSCAGGGLFALTNSSVTVTDSVFQDNGGITTWRGGGYCGNGILTGCTLRNNGALYGGGVHGDSPVTSTVLTDCIIENNRAEAASFIPRGGGAYLATLIGCTIESNLSQGRGGGAMFCELTDCTVRGNRAGALTSGFNLAQGAGISDCTATDCRLIDNTLFPCQSVNTDGGGGAFGSVLVGCILAGNSVESPGLGAAARDCQLDRCTVVGSRQLAGWGYAIEGAGLVTNTIVWGNHTDVDIDPYAPAPTLEFCDVEQGVMPGPGNLSSDPLFWSIDSEDFRLRLGSPCIDTGDPAAPLDPDGSRADMGALSFDPLYCADPYTYCVPKLNSLGCEGRMEYAGEPTLTGPDNFLLTAYGLPAQQFGIPIWSLGSAQVPFAGGTRCVANPLVRGTPTQSSSPHSGACVGAQIVSPFTQAIMLQHGYSVGTRVFAQFWYRDPSHPDGTGQALTDGLDFTICP